MQSKTSSAMLFLLLLFIGACKEKEMISEIIDLPTPSTCNFSALKIDHALCAFDQTTKTYFHTIQQDLPEFSPFIEFQDSLIELYINECRYRKYSG